ncbi:MAG: DNA sulfur modification protein DndD [Planctomycetaceae bacterium]
MILEELCLHNYCLYRGSHVFDLRPTVAGGKTRPIILFGGMNGAGKTTILDAVQLALYGSRTRSANRIGKIYDEYLRECVHRGADALEGASVSVKFRYMADGREHRYEVYRAWSVTDKSVRERVKVAKDDNVDQLLSEHWNDVVEELIPLGISQLFFFDAEKIRFLADDETDTTALGAAIKSLLGLDLAERLIADAAIVEKRLSDQILDRTPDERVDSLQRQLEEKSKELTNLVGERAALENQRLRAKTELDKAQAAFAAAGGDHWSRRSEIRAQLENAESTASEIEQELRIHCAGELPMLLIPELLHNAMEQDAREQEALEATAFHKALIERDRLIEKQFRDAGQKPPTVATLRKLFNQDRKARLKKTNVEIKLDLSGRSRGTLSRMLVKETSALDDAVTKLLKKLERAHATREKCLRLLSATPGDSEIASLVESLHQSASASGQLDGEGRRLDERIASLRRERDDLDKSLTDSRREIVDREIAHEESCRMAQLAHRTQVTMKDFLRRATAHKIDRLSDLITRSLRFLLRKQTLVSRVQIDPDTFRIELLDEAGTSIPKGRLSEGEKQVFAIALLWGLAQAAPRQLPAIIDTPMARLDSDHRRHLVERYFPNASHQTIILSTDTEIEQEYFEHLGPRVSRSYRLCYSDMDRCTVPEEGYFWNRVEPAGTEVRR